MVKQPTYEGYLSPVLSTGIKLLNQESQLSGVDSSVVFDELGIRVADWVIDCHIARCAVRCLKYLVMKIFKR